MIHRLAAPFIRHILAEHQAQRLSAPAAAEELQLTRSRFYRLFSEYLQAYGEKRTQSWVPGCSGGNHATPWPAEVVEVLRRLLGSDPPSSYSAAASELLRRFNFRTDRASIRRWALANQLAPDTRYKTLSKPV